MSKKIELKHLKYNLPPTLISQTMKCREELDEFITGVLRGDIDNSLEEFHDTVQAMLGVLQLSNIPVQEIVEAQQDHYKKLVKRGWKFND